MRAGLNTRLPFFFNCEAGQKSELSERHGRPRKDGMADLSAH